MRALNHTSLTTPFTRLQWAVLSCNTYFIVLAIKLQTPLTLMTNTVSCSVTCHSPSKTILIFVQLLVVPFYDLVLK